jgi:hypothetical protein
MPSASRRNIQLLVFALLLGLSVCAADARTASPSVAAEAHGGTQLARQPTHTVWQGGEATITGAIAAGTQLRVYAVLNQACRIGHFSNATCRPQSLLGWETVTEDGTFAPVPAPVAPYGVCLGDTVVVGNGHMHVIAGQLFACFTLTPTR